MEEKEKSSSRPHRTFKERFKRERERYHLYQRLSFELRFWKLTPPLCAYVKRRKKAEKRLVDKEVELLTAVMKIDELEERIAEVCGVFACSYVMNRSLVFDFDIHSYLLLFFSVSTLLLSLHST